MKNWLKIIKGETEKTSKEIDAEINGIEQQIEDAQTQADALRDELKQAGIERLGGGGSEKTITKLESEVSAIQRDITLLEDVKKSLCEKRAESFARENAERVVQIDKEIEILRASKKEMGDKAWALATDLAGLLYLSQGTHDSEILNIMSSDRDERIKFKATVKKFVDGQLPFLSQERALMDERKNLRG